MTNEQIALELYTPPFRFQGGYIWDAKNNMVSDDEGSDSVQRVRGWGKIGCLPEGEKIQDAVGELIARALTEFWSKERG